MTPSALSPLRRAAAALRLGRLAYLLWHAPRATFARSVREGGPINQWRNAQGRRAMECAVLTLPVSRAPFDPRLPELNFLTGRKFWYQTAFCLHSLQLHAGSTFRAVFHDDGSFDENTIAQLHALFPAAEIRRRADNDAHVAALLRPARFPTLHSERRHVYPNFLKLTDVHAGRTGWRLVLDSDMLFFRRPDFLLAWLAKPDRPFHMVDVGDAYGYPTALMSDLAGAPVPHCVNVGFAGLQSEAIDWERLEAWSRQLIAQHGTHYYLEQALTTMLFAGRACAVAPREDYRVLPTLAECRTPSAVMHHYVAGSKRGYFRDAWRHIASITPV